MSDNLFEEIPPRTDDEFAETLASTSTVRVGRIVSRGHCSPEGFWYDQEDDEFALLVRGSATLVWADGRRKDMKPGDHIWIPAHSTHRVEQTDPDQETIWLTVYARA